MSIVCFIIKHMLDDHSKAQSKDSSAAVGHPVLLVLLKASSFHSWIFWSSLACPSETLESIRSPYPWPGSSEQ